MNVIELAVVWNAVLQTIWFVLTIELIKRKKV